MSELGLPYLPRSQVWTKKSLDKYSYCLPYLPIQKVWTFFNWSLPLNVYFAYFFMYGHQYLTYLPWKYLSKLFLAKVWLKNTLPTYSLNICPNFCSFCFFYPSLRQSLEDRKSQFYHAAAKYVVVQEISSYGYFLMPYWVLHKVDMAIYGVIHIIVISMSIVEEIQTAW